MKKKSIISIMIAVIGTVFGLTGCGKSDSVLNVTLLKVGKADAIICEIGEHTLIIDTGEDDDGDELVEFLQDRRISRVNALIITHFDKDHVGGADTLLSKITIDQVIVPAYESTGSQYKEFVQALEDADITPIQVTSQMTLSLGNATVTIDPPSSYEVPGDADEYDNNLSLLTTIVYGEKKLFFTGDIEEERITELVEAGELPDCDFLKIPHHGSYTPALDDLFRLTSPEFAVICSSKKNPADERTLELLDKYGVKTAETRDGDITIVSDGTTLKLSQG